MQSGHRKCDRAIPRSVNMIASGATDLKPRATLIFQIAAWTFGKEDGDAGRDVATGAKLA